jgi:hypothetical protein
MACAGLGMLLGSLGGHWPRITRTLSFGLVALSALGYVRQAGAPRAALTELGDRLDDLTRRELEPDAIVFASAAETAFRQQGREAEEQLRADVTLVPLALSTLPHAVDTWVHAQPELADALRSWVLHNRLDLGSLQSLSAQRPVYLSAGTTAGAELFAASLDEGLLLRVVSDGPTATDLRLERGAQAARLGRLYPLPAAAQGLEGREVRAQLGRAHLFQALERAALGDREGAHDYVRLSQSAGFVDACQTRLDAALTQPGKIDMTTLVDADEAP